MTRRRAILILAVAYLALLAASHLVRISDGAAATRMPHDQQTVTLSSGVEIAYREYPAVRHGSETPVLLLHGSPGSSGDFRTLAPALASQFRVLAPDLPGFGNSTRRVADYSIRSHAAGVVELLDRLAIDSAHVVGFSMGGGVALEIAGQQPARLRSLTLLSAIGVQELELLGSYPLNHALHGLQLALLTVVHEGLPHFGLLDGFPLDVPYARNFYDSDQRPLRAVLRELEMPALVLHGKRDILVPVAAAREHHRLMPHSELLLLDTNHFMVFRSGDSLAAPIIEFLTRVERGQATSRAGASAERLAAASRPFDPSYMPPAGGMTLAVLMLLLALATFASEDLASIGSGLLIAQGRIDFFAGATACFLGILAGDIAIYLGGRLFGRPWLRRAPFTWILTTDAVERAERWFRQRGLAVIFSSRFLPGTRVATYFAAGVLGARFWRFLLYLSLAVAIWVPLIVGLSALLGSRLFDLFDTLSRIALPMTAVMALAGWLAFRALRALLTWRGRRLLRGRWLRLTRWEFWPPWLFYLPVLAHIARLSVRHRSLAVFTAANPGIPAGGFIGESKAAILSALDPRFVARFALLQAPIPAGEPRQALAVLLEETGLAPPLVLKPDVGQRGEGVVVARDLEDAEGYVARATGDILLQEYVAGPELGVFYYRMPGDERGEIFSITDKRRPTVVGDGRATLEELILADQRAVAMAAAYLDHLGAAAGRIPVAGEVVTLIDVGTHCRGAVFLDGRHFTTPELESTVEEISRSFSGFYFGRYDLKAPSYDDFRRARNVKVIELNGVTSEATHIYDPGTSLLDAYRVLFRQWETAFEIGSANRRAGAAAATSIRELVGRVVEYRRAQRRRHSLI